MHPYQLPAPFQVETPQGHGYAILVESDLEDMYWTVVLDNGAIVTYTQDRIRASRNFTLRRGISDQKMRKILRKTLKA